METNEQIEIRTQKISQLQEIQNILANTYLVAAVPGVANYKLSLQNLKNSVIGELSGNVYTKLQVDNKISGIVIPETDLTNYYTKIQVDNKISGIVIPETDLTNYYTKTQVDSAIASAVLSGSVNLDEYATDAEVSGAIQAAISAIVFPLTDLSGYVTETQLNNVLSGYQPYILLSGYVTEQEFNEQINILSGYVHQVQNNIEVSGYVTEQEFNEQINTLSGIVSNIQPNTDFEGYITEQEFNALVNTLSGMIADIQPGTEITGYVTEQEFTTQINILSGIVANIQPSADTSEIESKVNQISGQLSILEEALTEINSSDDEDDVINTLAEVTQFLSGYSENNTLSGILFALKESIRQEILAEIASGYVQSLIVK